MTIEQAIDDLMDASRSIAEVAESESDEANRINAQNVADDCKQLAELLRELMERRKQQKIVQCKDCKWWKKQKDSAQGRCRLLGIYPTGAWYCANGAIERRTDADD